VVSLRVSFRYSGSHFGLVIVVENVVVVVCNWNSITDRVYFFPTFLRGFVISLYCLRKATKMSYGRPPPRIEGMVSLKVDNLTYRTTPEDLRRVFERCGEVGDIYIPRDRFSRESRGFAFVRWVEWRNLISLFVKSWITFLENFMMAARGCLTVDYVCDTSMDDSSYWIIVWNGIAFIGGLNASANIKLYIERNKLWLVFGEVPSYQLTHTL
jgi:hypothetical protein